MNKLQYDNIKVCEPQVLDNVESFASFLFECKPKGISAFDLSQRNVIKHLFDRLKSFDAKTIVVERDYIDHDFLDDYALYYSRCFEDYERHCVRLHFFDKCYNEDGILDAIENADLGTAAVFRSSYIGFVVVRPLPKTIIGRTCLSVRKCCRREQFFLAVRKLEPFFFGMRMQIECQPFQEQDTGVAACATSAIWSALNITASLFSHASCTPAHITLLAKSHGHSLYRTFPNHEGLSANEMVHAMRSAGLEVVTVPAGMGLRDSLRKNALLGNVYAYVSAGIPVVLVGRLVPRNGIPIGMHAVTVVGYEVSDTSQNEDGSNERRQSAWDIVELYVNDDQMGPYVSMQVSPPVSKYDLTTSWTTKDGKQIDFRLEYLLIPIYDKIRVTYEDVWDVLYPFEITLRKYLPKVDIKWQIRLVKGNEFKESVRESAVYNKKLKQEVLYENLPKYIWKITAFISGKENVIFAVDATDSGQGLSLVCALFIFTDLARLAGAVEAWGKKIDGGKYSKANIVYEACLKKFKMSAPMAKQDVGDERNASQ